MTETFWPAFVATVTAGTVTRHRGAKVFLRDGEVRVYVHNSRSRTADLVAEGTFTARRGAGTARQPLVLDMADGSVWTVVRRGCACGAAGALQSFRPEEWE